MGEVLEIRSLDVDAIERTWRRFVPSAKLVSAESPRFEFCWRSASLAGFTVMEYEVAAGVRAEMTPAGLLFPCRISGRDARVSVKRREWDGSQPWLPPASRVETTWSGRARVHGFLFDHGFAERMARRATGDDRLTLVVNDAQPASTALGRYWWTAFEQVRDMLMGERDLGPMIEAELRRHALQTTLTAFPTTFLDAAERAAQRRPAGSSVRRAKAYMDSHAHQPITVDEVAAAVHMSTRGLQYAFRRAGEDTPMRYLRRVRLAGAHEELQRNLTDTVGAIARRWGFAHVSRFAQYYRDAYGTLPGDVRGG